MTATRPLQRNSRSATSSNESSRLPATTSTDAALNTRVTESDALGRLKRVTEHPGGSDPDYVTTYKYDVLGNLREVNQGPPDQPQQQQRRYYAYDSLSRLVRSRNPEQETNSDLDLKDVNGNTINDPVTNKPKEASPLAQAFGVLQTIGNTIADPANETKLWNYVMYREPPKPLGSTDFVVFIRKDVAQYWHYLQYQPLPSTDVPVDKDYSKATPSIDAP